MPLLLVQVKHFDLIEFSNFFQSTEEAYNEDLVNSVKTSDNKYKNKNNNNNNNNDKISSKGTPELKYIKVNWEIVDSHLWKTHIKNSGFVSGRITKRVGGYPPPSTTSKKKTFFFFK